jgi:hypothetical protein
MVFCATANGSDRNQPVSDETLRLAALHVIFPRMEVSVDQGKRIDHSSQWRSAPDLFVPDALKNEPVYRVIGKAQNQAEGEACADVVTGRRSDVRQVRFKLFRWPSENTAGLLAVLQYDFADTNPAMSVLSIGLQVHLVRGNVQWDLRDQYLLETMHHSSLQRVELLDLTGDGVGELVIESNFGGAGTWGTSLQVFDLTHGRFNELLLTDSRLEYMDQERYTKSLDVDRTLRSHGQRFCFTNTILLEEGKAFKPPRLESPCYERGEGVRDEDREFRKTMLAPTP